MPVGVYDPRTICLRGRHTNALLTQQQYSLWSYIA